MTKGGGGEMEDDFLSYFVGFALFHRGVIKFMYVKTCCESENGKKWKTFSCFIYWRSLASHLKYSDYIAEGKRFEKSLANYDANYAY